jgi:hypothetical protein
LRIRSPKDFLAAVPRAAATRRQMAPNRHDRRIPKPGAVLVRQFRDREILVTVLPTGFEFDGRQYGSLSAIASEVTGTRWNGLAFFGLTRRHNNVANRRVSR